MFNNRIAAFLWWISCALAFFAGSSAYAYEKVISYCVDPDRVPYEMLRNGKHVGVSADYLLLIGELAKVNFKLVPTDSWEQSLEYVQTGKCMLVPMINKSANSNVFLKFTVPYFESPNVLVSRGNGILYQGFAGITNQVVGVSRSSFLAEYLARYYPNLRLQMVESDAKGLQELNKGSIDILVGPALSINSEIARMNLQGVSITGYAEPYNFLRIGVNKAYPDLVVQLNEAIEQIPEAAKFDIYQRWNITQKPNEQDFRLLIVVVACIAVVLATLFWRRTIMRRYSRELRLKQDEMENLQSVLLEKNRMLEFLSSHDSATNLYNRNFMLHRAEDEVSRFNRFHTEASLILFDFTNPNVSQYSSQGAFSETGMRELARICLRSVREVDIAGRWSAEQIIILCPQTPISAAKILADRIKDAVETHPRDDIRLLPFSIGLAALQESENFAEWYERTSQALYLARRQHSGKVMIAEN